MKQRAEVDESFKQYTRQLFRAAGTNIKDVYEELSGLKYDAKIAKLKRYLRHYSDEDIDRVYRMYLDSYDEMGFIDKQIDIWMQKKAILSQNGHL